MRNLLKAFLILMAIAVLTAPAFADSDQPGDAKDPQAPPTATPPPPPPKPPAAGPIQIKVNDNVYFRFGILLQPMADFQEFVTNATTGDKGTSENFMLRRERFIVSGQLAKNAFFFFQTENSRLGNAAAPTGAKVISTGFQTVDAVIEYRYSKPLNLWAGLIYIPSSREALKGSASEFMFDVNTYAFTATTALAGTAGRDTGFMARGYFLGDKLEYRAGLFQGLRQAGSRNSFRQIARLQYEFADTEPYALPSYAGSYFGTKRVITAGASYDKQGDYKGPTADLYVDVPTGFGSALGTVTFMHLDGGTFVPTLGRSNIFVADGGLFFKGSRLGPWLRYEKRNFANPNSAKNIKSYWAGINWYPFMNNFNMKFGIKEDHPVTGPHLRETVAMMQVYYN